MTAEAKTETLLMPGLRGIADSTARRAHRAILTAHERFEAAAHFNGAMLGMLALIRQAEQQEEAEQATTEPAP